MRKQTDITTLLKWMITTVCILFMNATAYSQSERKLVRDGNKLYKDKKFSDAEVNYKKSLDVNKDSKTAQFNLGDAYYKQGKFDDATRQFQQLSSDSKLDKEQKAKAYHNLGNSYLQSKKYDESINAFKNALKLQPKDNDTRYNLAYAQSMLQQQQQQQQQQNKDKDKDKKDDKKDQQKQQENKDQEQKKDDQKKDEQSQAKRDKISKEDAEKILQALNNDEKNTQKKQAKKDATRIAIDKKW